MKTAHHVATSLKPATINTKLSIGKVVEDALADTDKPTAEQAAAERAADLGIDIGQVSAGTLRTDLLNQTVDPGVRTSDVAIGIGRQPLGDVLADSGLLPGESSGGSESDQEEVPSNPLAGLFEGDSAQGTHQKSEYTDADGNNHVRTVSTYDDMVVVTDINIDAGKETTTFLVNGKALTSERPWPPIEPVPSGDASSDSSGGDESSEGASGEDTSGEESAGGGVIDAIIDFFSDLFSGEDDGASASDNGAETKSGATTPPGEDYLSPQERMDLLKSLGLDQIYRGSHDNDEIQPTDDGGIPGASDAQVDEVPDMKELLLGGDRVDGLEEHVHVGGRTPSTDGGDIDWGPDHDAPPQTTGPEERDTQREIESEISADSKAQQTTSTTLYLAHKLELAREVELPPHLVADDQSQSVLELPIVVTPVHDHLHLFL